MAFRQLLVAALCACCAALQPSYVAAPRASRIIGRAAAPIMKRPDYFVRVARAEAGRPRLCVFRSNNHIYAQIIDDSQGTVLAAASSTEKDCGDTGANCAGATAVGKRVASRAAEKGVSKVFFDRNGRVFHGRVKALADGAREAGLDF